VRAAAARTGWSASSVLMPLSFAVTLGGMTTLVGTSTNLVVSGFLVESGQRPLGIFELSRIGVPVAVLGVLTLVLLSPRLLSTRRSPTELFSEEGREYAVEMEVRERGNLVGSSVADAGLRHLQGVFLAWVQRAGRVVAPVEPAFVLQAGDHLGFVGSVQHVVDLQAMSGLRGAALTHARGLEDRDHRFVEVVVASGSPLVGQTLRNQAFREQYRAAVLAIHRAGARLEGKLGDIPLRSGDTLLLIAERGFAARWRDRRDFLLVSERDGALSIPSAKGWFVLCVTVAMMLAAALDWLPILHGALAAATLMVLTGIITPHEARNAVDLDVLLLIAASFGLGAAIETSGLATQIAGWLVVPTTPLGPIAVLAALVVATLVLTQVMANNAAAALMFPIATAAAEQSGANPRSFAIAIALAASAAFLTPIGYQTNTMILGPGGYRFSDYWKLGLPVTIVVGVGIVVSTGAG
jgi:di/tricarboxylate transporter